jgi:hypothetical protein
MTTYSALVRNRWPLPWVHAGFANDPATAGLEAAWYSHHNWPEDEWGPTFDAVLEVNDGRDPTRDFRLSRRLVSTGVADPTDQE